MELLDFINSHDEWRTLLTEAPYHLKIKNDYEDYFIIEYNMIMSDFFNPICRQTRGAIVRYDNKARKYICVARSLDKFHNFSEKYSAINDIEWRDCKVLEKRDGSIIRLWYDKDTYHLSTNGCTNAFDANCSCGKSFGQIFVETIGEDNFNQMVNALDPSYTYWFELCTRYNRIVVRYPDDTVCYLGARNMQTMEETHVIPEGLPSNIIFPRSYNYSSLAKIVEVTGEMGEDEEGFVIVNNKVGDDGSFARVKAKGSTYLALHRLRGNGALTTSRVVEMWQQDTLDDFMAYFPEYNDFVNSILATLRHLISISDIAFTTISGYSEIETRADFAKFANTYIFPLRAYLFAQLDGKCAGATDFYKKMRAKTLGAHIDTILQTKSVGVEEDE